jgi:hypothetical protein
MIWLKSHASFDKMESDDDFETTFEYVEHMMGKQIDNTIVRKENKSSKGIGVSKKITEQEQLKLDLEEAERAKKLNMNWVFSWLRKHLIFKHFEAKSKSS